ncbi:putative LRR receptor-like serine/threonine-protein kinase [Dichanthelium oligosanthes]|uniref:Receptor kinase-like protein Xa21 n=1 Tax=Dichanthelium oligosanthes TaxID=888268 RepID=A0A1E5W2G3_9POAL|nr:putative LRR receptor-like serine/threonine-protein kinase [Dichanthelium oligosanthes]
MTKVTRARAGSRRPIRLFVLALGALLVMSYGAGSVSCGATPGGEEDGADLLSLLDFKRAINNDPRGALTAWNASAHFCLWNGVRCSSGRTRRVVALDLAGQGLSGQIAASLGNLSSLAALNLSTNGFSGPIPPRLGHLAKLRSLDLSYNSLQGSIPAALTNCSVLMALNLSRNFLVGEIPAEIGSLSNLTFLNLRFNNLTGIIPPELCNATSLEELRLTYNQLGGSIPEGIGKLTELRTLSLAVNRISDMIPESLFNLSLLQLLSLADNRLNGQLQPVIGSAFPNLQFLDLGGNMFEGYVPASLGNLSSIQEIDLLKNRFRGKILVPFGMLPDLVRMNVEVNNIEAKDSADWQFLNALCNCSHLKMLGLYGNHLQGVVPSYIGNLSSSLQYLSLGGDNNLTGVLPSSIGNLRNLTWIAFGHTSAAGTIGEWIGRLENLQGLYIPGNNFVGPIPSSIGNLTNLAAINLYGNGFTGLIPSTIGDLPQLTVLSLGHNNFHGTIPKEILRIATLTKCLIYENNLEGLIPAFGNLLQLTSLDLSANKLSGEIPASLGTCQELQTIEMGQNFLSGSIPVSLSNLTNLAMLNLSHNNLSGTIPAALSDIQLLSQLDLSGNHLEGEIPRSGVFRNVTGIFLEGNWGLCGGVQELHMPSCPAVPQETRRSKMLVKILVPIFGFLVLMLLIYSKFIRKRTSRIQLSLLSTGDQFPRVSYKALEQATDTFAEFNLIGRGSSGSVYRGRLTQPNKLVAVKVFHLDMQDADRSYMAECKALRNIRHRNLLPILTACSSIDNRGKDFKALVYEYMTNGNLDTWLHPTGDRNVLNQLGLSQRIDIIVDIADALQYLHHDCESPIIHCDLKPSNILLDDNMVAHLGDFGIARFYLRSMLTSGQDLGSIGSVGLRGTIGYIAPEYAGGSSISISGDVYSFGVALLEILTGKRPTDPMFCNGLTIVDFVEKSYQHEAHRILDACLQEECHEFARSNVEEENKVHQCLQSLITVALSCACRVPSERMSMRETAAKLHAIKISYRHPIPSCDD